LVENFMRPGSKKVLDFIGENNIFYGR